MRIAVTGSTGFLGTHFVRHALSQGHELRLLQRHGAPGAEHCKVFEAALPSPADGPLREFLGGADVLVHLAAAGVQRSGRTWDAGLDVNVQGTVQLIRTAKAAGIRKLVLIGTCLEYRGYGVLPERLCEASTPLCDEDASIEAAAPYGATKAAAGIIGRALARELDLPFWYLRIASLYGEGDKREKFVPAAVSAARERRAFPMSGGAQVREWMHVRDAVRAIELAIHEQPALGGTVLNIGTGEGLALSALVHQIFERAGADPRLVQLGALPYGRGEPHKLVMDVRRAAQQLNFQARERLSEGLDELMRNSA